MVPAATFYLRPDYRLKEHVHFITAVNCGYKLNVKHGSRFVCGEVQEGSRLKAAPTPGAVDLNAGDSCNLDMTSLKGCL
jgi:hypothetical protein